MDTMDIPMLLGYVVESIRGGCKMSNECKMISISNIYIYIPGTATHSTPPPDPVGHEARRCYAETRTSKGWSCPWLRPPPRGYCILHSVVMDNGS